VENEPGDFREAPRKRLLAMTIGAAVTGNSISIFVSVLVLIILIVINKAGPISHKRRGSEHGEQNHTRDNPYNKITVLEQKNANHHCQHQANDEPFESSQVHVNVNTETVHELQPNSYKSFRLH
jgi:hypothetical protein